ncbi:MAG: hypothetical protein GY716_10030 [bacterium]|nr:hypothetical protein [bacterium]
MSTEQKTNTEITPEAIMDETLSKHHGCMWVLAEVEACLDQPDKEGMWVEELRDALPRLGVQMRRHFKEEEGGALYRKLPTTHPRLATRLEKLENEHALILERIDGAVERVTRLKNAQPYELRELNAHVQMLVAMIQRHEAAENELVIEAHWAEFGGGD